MSRETIRLFSLATCLALLTSMAVPVLAQPPAEQKAKPEEATKKKEEKKGKEKFGKGELEIVEDLAKASGKSVDEILAMRKSGKGWGQIAHELGVKLGPAVSDKEKPEKGKGPKKAEEPKEKGPKAPR